MGDHVRTTPPLTCTQDSTRFESKETTKAIVRRSRRAHNAKPLKASKIAKAEATESFDLVSSGYDEL
jgi:hypothetical protein